MPSARGVAILTFLAAFILLSACSVHCQKYASIKAYLDAFPAKFSVLNGYLKKAGLDKVLANKDLAVTLFAPTNAAFAKVVKDYVGTYSGNVLAQQLLGHVATDPFKADWLRTGLTLEVKTDTYGSPPRTLLADSDAIPGSTVIRAPYSAAKITKGDVMAGKSYLHEIDTYLQFAYFGPQTVYTSILDAAQKLGLKKFAAALINYKPSPARLDIYDIAQNEGRGTIFGFTDAVYNKFVKTCQNPSRLPIDSILAYSTTFEVLSVPRMASRLQFTTFNFEMEEAVVAPPNVHRIAYLKGSKMPSIESEYGVFNITQTIHARYAVLHLLDGLMAPSDRDGPC